MASNFKSYCSSVSGTSNTTVFTATSSTTVIGFSIANVTSVAISSSALLSKNGGSSAYIVKNAPIPAGGSLIVVGGDQKIVLQISDSIKVSANTANSVDVIISTLEL